MRVQPNWSLAGITYRVAGETLIPYSQLWLDALI